MVDTGSVSLKDKNIYVSMSKRQLFGECLSDVSQCVAECECWKKHVYKFVAEYEYWRKTYVHICILIYMYVYVCWRKTYYVYV